MPTFTQRGEPQEHRPAALKRVMPAIYSHPARGESLPPEVGSFLATIRGRLRRRMNTASLDLVVNDEACAWARGQSSLCSQAGSESGSRFMRRM